MAPVVVITETWENPAFLGIFGRGASGLARARKNSEGAWASRKHMSGFWTSFRRSSVPGEGHRNLRKARRGSMDWAQAIVWDSAAAVTHATRLSVAQRNLLCHGFQGRLMLSFSTNHIQGN